MSNKNCIIGIFERDSPHTTTFKRMENKNLSVKSAGSGKKTSSLYKSSNKLNKIIETIREEEKQGPSITVVICDDENSIRDTTKNLLTSVIKEGRLIVIEAINGLDCLTKLYQKKDVKIDLLLIDEDMPYMKGSEVIQRLKTLKNESFHKGMKMVWISGNVNPDATKHLINIGCDDFLPKDIKKQDLKSLLSRYFPAELQK